MRIIWCFLPITWLKPRNRQEAKETDEFKKLGKAVNEPQVKQEL